MSKVAFPLDMQVRILAKTGARCTYCGEPVDPKLCGQCQPTSPRAGAWEVNNWTPKSWFKNPEDGDRPGNLWPACCGCNDEKADLRAADYILRRIKEQRPVHEGVVKTRLGR